MPIRASGHRDGGAIALVGYFWEIIEVTRFGEHRCACLFCDSACALRSETGAPGGRGEGFCEAPPLTRIQLPPTLYATPQSTSLHAGYFTFPVGTPECVHQVCISGLLNGRALPH